ncbi:MAG: DNA polymerase III subunit delta', partial [bacterium]
DTAAVAQVLTQTGNGGILQHPEILSIAAGSPGSAILAYQQLQTINSELLQEVKKTPKSYRHALELAKKIDKELDTEAQLWLIDYLQQFYWQQIHKPGIIEQLEKTRKNLLSYAQPRLVWECTFLAILQIR